MKVGTMVVLIQVDDFMPPLGSVGEIVGPLDAYGDHEVLFPHHPCPVSEPTWEIPCGWLMPVGDAKAYRSDTASITASSRAAQSP